jgi:dynein heavy chain, axonemal
MSLGQGQETLAQSLVELGTEEGKWIMLQNCHLFKSWMPQLALIVANLAERKDEIHEDFRLILTSMPEDYFPASVLQTGLKMTTEPPRGIKNNLQRSYMNIVTPETYDELTQHFEMTKRNFYSGLDTENASRRAGTNAAETISKSS